MNANLNHNGQHVDDSDDAYNGVKFRNSPPFAPIPEETKLEEDGEDSEWPALSFTDSFGLMEMANDQPSAFANPGRKKFPSHSHSAPKSHSPASDNPAPQAESPLHKRRRIETMDTEPPMVQQRVTCSGVIQEQILPEGFQPCTQSLYREGNMQTRPISPVIYREYMTGGSLSSDPLHVVIDISSNSATGSLLCRCPLELLKNEVQARMRLWGTDRAIQYIDVNEGKIKEWNPYVKSCKLYRERNGNLSLVLDIVRKGQASDPSRSLPLSKNHGSFPFYFVFEFPETQEMVQSGVFEVRSKETRLTREQNTVVSALGLS